MMKMDLKEIKETNDRIADIFCKMEQETKNLERIANAHYATLQDSIMQNVAALLAELQSNLHNMHLRAKRFSEAKSLGSTVINEGEIGIARKIDNI